jgi:hypothetical protein
MKECAGVIHCGSCQGFVPPSLKWLAPENMIPFSAEKHSLNP